MYQLTKMASDGVEEHSTGTILLESSFAVCIKIFVFKTFDPETPLWGLHSRNRKYGETLVCKYIF